MNNGDEIAKNIWTFYSNENVIRVSGIVSESVVDGPGIRTAVFAQGCSHQCPGCHNPETHSYNGGHLVLIDDILKNIEKNPMLDGISLSGGEPFDQASAMTQLATGVRSLANRTGRRLDIWCWTGYTAETLCQDADHGRPDWKRLLNIIDVLVDGPFIRECATMQCPWRGSANQRILSAHDIQMIFKKLAGKNLPASNSFF